MNLKQFIGPVVQQVSAERNSNGWNYAPFWRYWKLHEKMYTHSNVLQFCKETHHVRNHGYKLRFLLAAANHLISLYSFDLKLLRIYFTLCFQSHIAFHTTNFVCGIRIHFSPAFHINYVFFLCIAQHYWWHQTRNQWKICEEIQQPILNRINKMYSWVQRIPVFVHTTIYDN